MALSYFNDPDELDARRTAAEGVADDIICCLKAECGQDDMAAALGGQIAGLRIVADPAKGALPTDAHKAVMAFWRMQSGDKGLPDCGAFDVERLGAARDYCKLIEISPDNDEFSYREIGPRLAAAAGFDMSDCNIFDFREATLAHTFEAACYLTSRKLKRTLLSEYDSIPGARAKRSCRLIMPIGRNGEIARLFVCDVPLGV